MIHFKKQFKQFIIYVVSSGGSYNKNLVYKTFFDISNNFGDMSKKVKSLFIYEE